MDFFNIHEDYNSDDDDDEINDYPFNISIRIINKTVIILNGVIINDSKIKTIDINKNNYKIKLLTKGFLSFDHNRFIMQFSANKINFIK